MEFVNLSQNGFSTVNEAEMLHRLGWQFEPHLVVVQFCINDILPSGPGFASASSTWLPRGSDRSHPLPGRALRPERRAASDGGSAGGPEAWERTQRVEQWAELYRRQGKEWEDLADAIREMGDAAAARSVPIVLMIFPEPLPGVNVDDTFPLEPAHLQVGAHAGRRGSLCST